MSVAELIELLKDADPEAQVFDGLDGRRIEADFVDVQPNGVWIG